jgi:hypothetical protein
MNIFTVFALIATMLMVGVMWKFNSLQQTRETQRIFLLFKHRITQVKASREHYEALMKNESAYEFDVNARLKEWEDSIADLNANISIMDKARTSEESVLGEIAEATAQTQSVIHKDTVELRDCLFRSEQHSEELVDIERAKGAIARMEKEMKVAKAITERYLAEVAVLNQSYQALKSPKNSSKAKKSQSASEGAKILGSSTVAAQGRLRAAKETARQKAVRIQKKVVQQKAAVRSKPSEEAATQQRTTAKALQEQVVNKNAADGNVTAAVNGADQAEAEPGKIPDLKGVVKVLKRIAENITNSTSGPQKDFPPVLKKLGGMLKQLGTRSKKNTSATSKKTSPE